MILNVFCVMGISGRESTADIGGEEAETLPEATKCGGRSGGIASEWNWEL
ncbi:hypothetical protein A2U01_0108240, partial [Trifolium medium]|nr:hypothetical protein [Trifolium medium]